MIKARSMFAALFLAFLISPVLLASGQDSRREPDAVPLRNWMPALPQYAEAGEREGRIAAMALPSAASHFIALSPCRVADTRNAGGPYGGPMLTGGVSRAFNITSGPCAGIPVAAAYSLNMAVTGSTPGSIQFLTAYPAGTSRPLVATMNFDGGETTSNSALVPADALGAIEIYASTDTHVIIDINGYLKEGVVTSVTAGTGLAGGGTGTPTLSIAPGGVGATQLGASAVTTGAIQDGAVSANKIQSNQVVKSLNGLRDTVTINAGAGTTVSTGASSITVATAAPPSGTVVLGAAGDTTLLGAGYTELGPSGLHVWTPIATPALAVRGNHSAVWTGTRMLIWGGYNGAFLNSGSSYDPVADNWSPTSTGVNVPAARCFHSAVWTGSTMIIWGGISGVAPFNTGGIYNPSANTWTPTSNSAAPAARYLHSGVWATNTNVMVVWGGWTASTATNTGGLYNPAGSDSWSATSVVNAPTARASHTALWTGTPLNRMIVWGGLTGSATGGVYDPTAPAELAWSATSITGAPSARYYHAAVWTGTQMLVWGGATSASLNDGTGARYSFPEDTWSPMTTANAPAGRQFQEGTPQFVWTGSRMVIFGGMIGSAPTSTGGIYDPVADSWSATSTAGAKPRQFHTAIWTGREMIVFGGITDPETYTSTGERWNLFSYYRKN